MTTRYRAWRAVSPSDGASTWVIVDDDFELHDGGCAFLTGLRAADRSVNTERVYAGRVAMFLSWCATEGVDWTRPRLDHMVGFKRWLVAEPAPTREGRPRRRSTKSADAVLRTVCEFLRFGAHHELVDAALVDRLFEPRFLKFLPAGFEPGEDGQHRTVRSRLLRFAVAEEPFSFIEPERVDDLVAAAGNVRDRFLVTLVAMTGLRIGEALGLHRADMHFLSDSRTLGCKVVGPHLHVRRRPDNPNGALAKSRFSRSVPVAEAAVSLYADYAHEAPRLPRGCRRLASRVHQPLPGALGRAASLPQRKGDVRPAGTADRARGAPPPLAPHRRDHVASPGHPARHGPGPARPREPDLDAVVLPSQRGGQACRGGAGRRVGGGQAVSAMSEIAETISRLDAALNLDAWRAYLSASLAPVGTWRPDEFDPERWLFTGDPDNPMTTTCRCRTLACPTVVNSRSFCGRCREALAGSGLDEDEFARTYQPTLVVQRLTGEPCVVVRDGVRCKRRSISHRSGLCQAHTSRWINSRDRLGVTLEEWCSGVARPLPAMPECVVAGCHNDARRAEAVCRGHFLAWQAEQRRGGPVEPAGVWAPRQRPLLAAHQFSLDDLAPLPRIELLYALQQRDRQGHRLSPQAVRGLVGAWGDLDALVTTPTHELIARAGRSAGYRTYAGWVGRILGLKLEAFNGIVHTERDVWDCLALDLEIPRPGVRPNQSVLDFTPITQRWLREATKAWVATVRPETWHVQRTIQAATLTSWALEGRPGGGHDETALRFADLDAVFRSINAAVTGDGRLYDARYRRGLWASFHAVIDLGRATDILDGLPGVFSRHASHSIGHTDPDEGYIGKAVPETVIAQLDAHLDLLGVDGNYGRIWSPADTNALFATAYQVLRDTGRRPGEVVSLRTECLERDGDDWALVYDNHKKRRLRRRLPITAATARIIQAWQVRRGGIDLPQCAEGWLFPAARESSGAGHLTTIRLSQALRAWVDAIPELMSDVPGPDGQPQAFDRLAVYAYAFRHSYAQRHVMSRVVVDDTFAESVIAGHKPVGI